MKVDTSTPQTVGSALSARGISKHYGGVAALSNADFWLEQGEHVALVGDNGAGKSTLVRILSGAIQPDDGYLVIRGKQMVLSSPKEAQAVGIETVYQSLPFVEDRTVTENLFLGREKVRVRLGPMSILDRREMRLQTESLLANTGVAIPDLGARMRGLSGGQRQGVAIAKACGWGADVILMDEPTAALGVQETARVEETIIGLKQRGVTVLVISHNLRQVFDISDSIVVMRRGRVVGRRVTAETTPEEIVTMITGAAT